METASPWRGRSRIDVGAASVDGQHLAGTIPVGAGRVHVIVGPAGSHCKTTCIVETLMLAVPPTVVVVVGPAAVDHNLPDLRGLVLRLRDGRRSIVWCSESTSRKQ